MNPDGVRDYDLLVPASAEALVVERHADGPDALRTRRRRLARGVHRRARGHPAAQPPVRALLQRTTGRVGPGRRRGRRGDRAGLVILLGVGPDDTEAIADDLARKAAELRIFRDDEGRTNRSLLDVGGERARRLAVHALRRHAARAPAGVHRRRRRRTSPSGSTCGSPPRSRARRRRWRPAGSAPRWRSSSSTTARSRSGSTRTMAKADGKPDALSRLGGGRWETKDGRFQIEPQSGTWVIVDTTQTNEFGLPLVRGPVPVADGGARGDRGGARRGTGRVAAGRSDRTGRPRQRRRDPRRRHLDRRSIERRSRGPTPAAGRTERRHPNPTGCDLCSRPIDAGRRRLIARLEALDIEAPRRSPGPRSPTASRRSRGSPSSVACGRRSRRRRPAGRRLDGRRRDVLGRSRRRRWRRDRPARRTERRAADRRRPRSTDG